MSDRTFTLDEAQALLPVLESLLRAAIQAKQLMDEVDAEMQALHHRIFLNGGMFLEVLPLARRKGERSRAEQGAKDALAEIDSMGVQVKDLGIGLLDFPLRGGGAEDPAVLEAGRERHRLLAWSGRRICGTQAHRCAHCTR